MNVPDSIIFYHFMKDMISNLLKNSIVYVCQRKKYGVMFKQSRMIITTQRICKIMRVIGNVENQSNSKYTLSFYVTINVAPVV